MGEDGLRYSTAGEKQSWKLGIDKEEWKWEKRFGQADLGRGFKRVLAEPGQASEGRVEPEVVWGYTSYLNVDGNLES
jgi:hypothetical protein